MQTGPQDTLQSDCTFWSSYSEQQKVVQQINALDKKKLLMIIRGFGPTSDIIDFTSVERCNQYYISRESHFIWRILSLEKIHCTKRNLKFFSIAVYCNKSMSDKELQIKKKFKQVLAAKYWALLCCKLVCKKNSNVFTKLKIHHRISIKKRLSPLWTKA